MPESKTAHKKLIMIKGTRSHSPFFFCQHTPKGRGKGGHNGLWLQESNTRLSPQGVDLSSLVYWHSTLTALTHKVMVSEPDLPLAWLPRNWSRIWYHEWNHQVHSAGFVHLMNNNSLNITIFLPKKYNNIIYDLIILNVQPYLFTGIGKCSQVNCWIVHSPSLSQSSSTYPSPTLLFLSIV